MSVSVVLTRNTSIKRIILGSLIGGVSTFLLFINLSWLFSLLFKALLGIIMCIATYGFKSIRYTANNLFYLFTISFSIGGVLYLLMDKGYYNYFVLIIGFIVVCFLYVKQLKRMKCNYSEYYQVEIYYQNQIIKLIGFLDTGNKLYDNYKHRPIILVSQKIDYQMEDVIYVPYVSLNDEKILKWLKTQNVVINKHVFKNYLIGLSDKKFQIDGVNCLLHSKMKGDLNA